VRFLADESCDFAVVRALRSAGHDVIAVAEIAPRADDASVAEMAAREGRVLLTEDKDFGQLVYAKGQRTGSVILVRFPAAHRAELPAHLVEWIAAHADRLGAAFVVFYPGRARVTRLP
jgi:predicted nuclease of predicted toxin-antitoxin system